MNKTYSDQQIAQIRSQASTYQCACPAQVCVAISAIRELDAYQDSCLDSSGTDRAVHIRIKEASERNHAELEGWDTQTLKMPGHLQKQLFDDQN